MYSNFFDTVRTSDSEQLSMVGLLYTSILSDMRPTFTLNQAVDSSALFNIMQNGKDRKYLLKFVRDGNIRVGQYKNFYDKSNQKIDAITGYLTSILMPVDGRDRNPFQFSSLPFLYNEDYSDRQIQKIYNQMLNVIYENQLEVTRNICDAEHAEIINEHLQLVFKLRDALNGRYIPPADKSVERETLSKKISKRFGSIKEKDPGSEFSLCFNQTFSECDNDSRSDLYNIIEDIKPGTGLEQEAKELVNVCYNEVLAESIADPERSLMFIDDNYNNIIKGSQLYNISENDQRQITEHANKLANQPLDWDILYEVTSQVEGLNHEKRLENIEKLCKDNSRISFVKAGGNLLSVLFNVSGSVKGTIDITQFLINPYENITCFNIGYAIGFICTILSSPQKAVDSALYCKRNLDRAIKFHKMNNLIIHPDNHR